MKIDIKRGKFEIECSFGENHLIQGLPDKKFVKRKKCWTAHVLSRNSKFLLERLQKFMTEKAIEAAQESVQRSVIEYKPFPRDYPFVMPPLSNQWEALDKSYGLKRFAYYMEMGTGKTKTAIDLMSCRRLEDEIDLLLVFCPNGVISTWEEQIIEHCPFDWPVVVVESGKKDKILKFAKTLGDKYVVVVGMESLQSQEKGGSAYETVLDLVVGRRYGSVVDESHYIKSHESNRSLNVEFLTMNAHTLIIMTGTPIAHGFLDLFMPFKILDPNIIGIGDYFSFRSRYAIMGGYENREVIDYQNVEELMESVAPYIYQCRKEDVLDLPPKVYIKRSVKLTPEQIKAIRELNDDSETVVSTAAGKQLVEIEMVLAKYNAAQQIAGGFLNYDVIDEEADEVIRKSTWLVEPSKNPKILEIGKIAEENPGRQIIVWAKFRNEITMIVEYLKDKGGCSEYHGGVPKEDRKAAIEDFRSGKNRFFVANQQTGGTGLTLNNCSFVIYYSNSFKYIERVQSEDRCHRIGQENKVTYVDLVAMNSKDQEIMDIIKGHSDIAEYVKNSLRRTNA